MALAWADLPQTVTYEEAATTETADGNIVQSWKTVQTVQGLIQVYSGRRRTQESSQEDEGLLQKKLYFLYCNFVTGPAPGAPATAIQFAGRIVDAKGQQYRVEHADDEGGQGDHLKVLLSTQSPMGD